MVRATVEFVRVMCGLPLLLLGVGLYEAARATYWLAHRIAGKRVTVSLHEGREAR